MPNYIKLQTRTLLFCICASYNFVRNNINCYILETESHFRVQ